MTQDRSSGPPLLKNSERGETVEPFLSRDEIAARIKAIAREIDKRHNDKRLILISLLKGSVFFLADLARSLHGDVELYFMQLSSYGNSTRPGEKLELYELPLPNVKGQTIILVEDILDTGQTLSKAKAYFENLGCGAVEIAVLLVKEGHEKESTLNPDYIGFVIPDVFVVGYGLDYAERYRQLPDIGILHFDGGAEADGT